MLMPDAKYLYGRVILANLPAGLAPMPTSNLIYVYDVRTEEKTPPPIDSLTTDRLLIAPQFINRMPWTRGVFENVAHEPFGALISLLNTVFLGTLSRKSTAMSAGRLSRPGASPVESGCLSATACSMTTSATRLAFPASHIAGSRVASSDSGPA